MHYSNMSSVGIATDFGGCSRWPTPLPHRRHLMSDDHRDLRLTSVSGYTSLILPYLVFLCIQYNLFHSTSILSTLFLSNLQRPFAFSLCLLLSLSLFLSVFLPVSLSFSLPFFHKVPFYLSCPPPYLHSVYSPTSETFPLSTWPGLLSLNIIPV